MDCPRCHTGIVQPPEPGGYILCPGCGARLMMRAAALSTSTGRIPAPPPPGSPNATLPPGTPAKRIPRPGEDTARSKSLGGARPSATPAPAPRAEAESTGGLDAVLLELKLIRESQSRILALLERGPAAAQPVPAPTPAPLGDLDALERPLGQVRTRRRKTVLLIDDDAATRRAAVAQLEAADVPVRAVADGQAALQAIAEEKPDVIALELALGGGMDGRDVVNVIKATMEWIDIPIVLYTRASVESQKEARSVHGADELVPKRAGPAALVTRVIGLFRRPA
jgi:CheY-like chemotaxis protein